MLRRDRDHIGVRRRDAILRQPVEPDSRFQQHQLDEPRVLCPRILVCLIGRWNEFLRSANGCIDRPGRSRK